MTTQRTLKIGKQTVTYTHTQTRGVLAGVYRGSDKRNELTHMVFCDGDNEWVRTGCRQPVDNMADSYSGSDEDLAQAPTCPTCAKRWAKLQG